jgi:hypothetical protein
LTTASSANKAVAVSTSPALLAVLRAFNKLRGSVAWAKVAAGLKTARHKADKSIKVAGKSLLEFDMLNSPFNY